MRQKLAVAACLFALAGLSAGSALAGEVTGSGKTLWTNTTDPNAEHQLHGKSACAFSGLNDNYVFGTAGPGNPDEDGFTRTQSWGQVVRNLGPVGGHLGVPGTACNPAAGGEG